MHPLETVFCRQHKGFGQIVTGDDLAVALCPAQKFPGALGGGGVVHIEDADNRGVPHRHIVTDVQIHTNPPFFLQRLLLEEKLSKIFDF